MGIRGELFSTKVSCEGRTYFFNVKQNRMGDIFLSIVESKPTEAESFDRRSIVVFREDMRGFLKAFQTTLSYIEKPGAKPTEMSFEPPDEPVRARRPRAVTPDGDPSAAGRTARSDHGETASSKAGDTAAEGKAVVPKRRIVVRKKPASGEAKKA